MGIWKAELFVIAGEGDSGMVTVAAGDVGSVGGIGVVAGITSVVSDIGDGSGDGVDDWMGGKVDAEDEADESLLADGV